ncbi:UNVERIFIED_CONTAM: Electrogenic sodium bicarbonate cotransporter 4 [Gekko kuhli]
MTEKEAACALLSHVLEVKWLKFEEKVEEGGERWSKPHVSTLSLHSLFELRTCLQTGTVMLDLDGYSLPQIIDDVIEKQIEDGLLKPELREKISYVLLRKHRHQTKKPIHRSLADIGKSVSSTNRSPVRSPAAGASFHRSTEDLRMRQSASYGRLHLHFMGEVMLSDAELRQELAWPTLIFLGLKSTEMNSCDENMVGQIWDVCLRTLAV